MKRIAHTALLALSLACAEREQMDTDGGKAPTLIEMDCVVHLGETPESPAACQCLPPLGCECRWRECGQIQPAGEWLDTMCVDDIECWFISPARERGGWCGCQA